MSFIPRLPSLLIALAALARPLCAEGEVPEGFAVEADGSLLVLVRRTNVHDANFKPQTGQLLRIRYGAKPAVP